LIAKREALGLYELLWIIGALSFLIATAVILQVALQPAREGEARQSTSEQAVAPRLDLESKWTSCSPLAYYLWPERMAAPAAIIAREFCCC
jgi:hypothetical protein